LKQHLITITEGNEEFGEERDRETIELREKNRALELDLAAGQSLLADLEQTQASLQQKNTEAAVMNQAISNLESVVQRLEDERVAKDIELTTLRNEAREVLFIFCHVLKGLFCLTNVV